MIHGVDHVEEFPCTAIIPHFGERHHGPYSGMRVLSAVFSDTGDITLYISRIHSRFIEGGIKELDQPTVSANEPFV